MMRRALLVLGMSIGMVSHTAASSLEDSVESRWRGAWVVVLRDVASSCDGFYTDNRVSDDLVASKGRRSFPAGELARVDKLDLKRSGLDMDLALLEPILVSFQDGPFTLYAERSCKIEVMFEVPREWISGGRADRIDQQIGTALERHANEAEARRSSAWNRRQRDPYPADYRRTLAEHEAWKASQFNAAVDAAHARSLQEAARVTERLHGDPDYLAGFASGVETARDHAWGECQELVYGQFAVIPCEASRKRRTTTPAEAAWLRGYEDGQRLLRSLALLRDLPGCYLPVPDASRMGEAGN